MRVALRRALSGLVSADARRALKSFEFAWRKRMRSLAPRLDAAAFRSLFTDTLGVRSGGVVMIHGSLSLVPTQLSAEQVLEILRETVGPDGTLVAPTFPRMASIDFMNSAELFDARNTRSGMGALSEAVRRAPGSVRSTHPTKSVAALGPAAQEICTGHEKCLYPFGVGSPYEKMLELGVQVIGVGAPMSYLSFVHVAEDLAPELVDKPVWDPQTYQKPCLDMDGREHVVQTVVHNMALMPKANPEKFCRTQLNPTEYRIARRSMADFFSVDGRALTKALKECWRKSITIYD